MSGSRRVAIVVDRITDYQIPVIRGAESVLRAAGAALMIVINHPLNSRQDSTIGRLVGGGLLHGVIIMPMPDLSTERTTVDEVAALTTGVPGVSISVRLAGIPTVLSDNAGGIRAALIHLLDECGRQRPLLLAGTYENDDSIERVDAFTAMVAERGLDLPRDPVVHAQFLRENGYRQVIERLNAGLDFDAIVASNDSMAFGALDALRERGLRVPEDVALVGFDNVAEAYLTDPPLTTVDIQLEEQGAEAARLLLDQLDGKAVPERVRAASTLLVRSSSKSAASGDLPSAALTALAGTPAVTDGVVEPLQAAERVLAALAAVNGPVDEEFQKRLGQLGAEWIPQIITGTADPGRGVELRGELIKLVVLHPEPLWWHDLVATTQAALAAASPDGTLAAATEAGILRMTLYIERALASVREQRDRDVLAISEHVLELNRALSRCRSLADLTTEVSAYLARLNVRRCFVALLDRPVATADMLPRGAVEGSDPMVDDDPLAALRGVRTGPARLALSYRDFTPDPEPDQTPFEIDELLPPSLAGELEHGTLTLQPLFTTERWFGVVLHEQTVLDRHTAEAIRIDTGRVLDALARATEMTARASELEALVSMRTEQLELEVASRRAAQESLHGANLELRRALLLDGLTGLQNRPSFDEHLNRAWHQHLRGGEPMSVLMIDVDHFKRYNDTYGHLAGDTCLRKVARCLQSAVTRKQDIVARFGGEEFAVVLPETDAEGAWRVAQRLLDSLRLAAIPHASSDHQWVTVSIGVSSSTDLEVERVEALLDLADRALYAAKRNGRDRVERSEVFAPDGTAARPA